MNDIYRNCCGPYGSVTTLRYPRGSSGPYSGPVPVMGVPAALNPTPIVLLYDQLHTGDQSAVDGILTDRFRYTVPLYRRLMIQNAQVRQAVIVSFASVAEFFSEISVLRKGKDDRKETLIGTNNNNQNHPERSRMVIQHGFFPPDAADTRSDSNVRRKEIFSGDTIFGSTFTMCNSGFGGGGVVRFILSVIAVEYDER